MADPFTKPGKSIDAPHGELEECIRAPLRIEGRLFSRFTIAKDVCYSAFEAFQEVFQRLQRDVLFAHFHSMKRRRRNTQSASKSRITQLPALFAQELAELLLQRYCHAGSVSRQASHMWEILLLTHSRRSI